MKEEQLSTHTEALFLIDEHLAPSNSRSIYSVEEVQNLLLDLRTLLAAPEEQEALALNTLAT